MANSQYEYVKGYEFKDEVPKANLIVICIKAPHFLRFLETHLFQKTNDEKAVHLMNSCATAVLEEFPDIIFGYGFDDEYNFVLARKSKIYKRRASKLLSLIVSFFTSVFVKRWKEYFDKINLSFPLIFESRIIACESTSVLQAYLSWRQNECHVNNQCNKYGNAVKDAEEFLKGSKKHDKHELLGVNYKELPDMFRHGSCVLKKKVECIVKYLKNGTPIKRLRTKINIVHSENIASKCFWNEHLLLVKEVDNFEDEIDDVKPEYLRLFLFDKKLVPSSWIVVRIDGCHFHKFSEVHEFEKPNDAQALNLMNSCAVAVLKEFRDITFSYGASDEYSFVLKKDSRFYQRRTSGVVSAIVSFFSSVYIMNWKIFFPKKELKYSPCFDGRAICYESEKLVRDYLAWRQVDCHINNQYNTCFWMLVKDGKSKKEAYNYLKGTKTRQKNDLFAEFDIEYPELPIMYRLGSSVFWDMRLAKLTPKTKLAMTGNVEEDEPEVDQSDTEEPTKKQSVFQYKSNLKTVVEKINSLKFTEGQLQMLRETCPFANLIDVIRNGTLKVDQCRKSDVKLVTIVRKFDKETKSLRIGKDLVPITKNHISQIFGISTEGTEIINYESVAKDKNCAFTSKFFKKTVQLSKTAIEQPLDKAMTDESVTDWQEVSKLMTMYLLCAFFVTTSSMSLGWGYVKIVLDIAKVMNYDWSEHIHDRFITSLKSCTPEKVTCCVLVIPYILLEKYNICQPLKENEANIVLCTKWDLPSFFRLFKKCTNVDTLCVAKGLQNVEIDSEPTEKEQAPAESTEKQIPPAKKTKKQKKKEQPIKTVTPPRVTRSTALTPTRITRSSKTAVVIPSAARKPKSRKKTTTKKAEMSLVDEDSPDEDSGYDSETLAEVITRLKHGIFQTPVVKVNVPEQTSTQIIPYTPLPIFRPEVEKENDQNEENEEEEIVLEQRSPDRHFVDFDVFTSPSTFIFTKEVEKKKSHDEESVEEEIIMEQPYDDVDMVPETQTSTDISKEIDEAAEMSKHMFYPDDFVSDTQPTVDATMDYDSEATEEDLDTRNYVAIKKTEAKIAEIEKERNEQVQKLEEELKAVQNELLNFKNKAEQQKLENERQVDSLLKRVEQGNREIQDMKMSHEDEQLKAQAEIAALAKKMDELKKEYDTERGLLRAEMEEAETEREYYKNKLDEQAGGLTDQERGSRVEFLEKLVADMTAQQKLLSKKQRPLEAEIERLNSQLADANAKNEAFEKNLISKKKFWAVKQQSYRAEIQLNEGKIEKIQNELLTFKKLLEEESSKLEQLSAENNKLLAENEELQTHNSTQQASFLQRIEDLLVEAGVHDVTQADRITKHLVQRLRAENAPTSAVRRVIGRVNRKPATRFTPSKSTVAQDKPAAPTRVLRKRKQPEPKDEAKIKPAATRVVRKKNQPEAKEEVFKTPNLGDVEPSITQVDQQKKPAEKEPQPKEKPVEKEPAPDAEEELPENHIKSYDPETGDIIIVDLSALEDVVVRPKRQHNLLKRDSPFTRWLPDDIYEEIRRIHKEQGVMVTLMSNTNIVTPYCITLEDVYKITDCDRLCNSTINVHAVQLMAELKSDETRDFKIFDSLIWSYIRDEERHKLTRKRNIDQVLDEHYRNPYKKLLFPMNSNENRELKYAPDHWTLLVLDVPTKKWTHYNSNLTRATKRNEHIEDANVVMDYVVKYLTDLTVMSFHISLNDSQPTYEFEDYKDCPQQGDTVDCAVYVCHAMEMVAKNMPMPTSIETNDLYEYKTKMIRVALDEFKKNEAPTS